MRQSSYYLDAGRLEGDAESSAVIQANKSSTKHTSGPGREGAKLAHGWLAVVSKLVQAGLVLKFL